MRNIYIVLLVLFSTVDAFAMFGSLRARISRFLERDIERAAFSQPAHDIQRTRNISNLSTTLGLASPALIEFCESRTKLGSDVRDSWSVLLNECLVSSQRQNSLGGFVKSYIKLHEISRSDLVLLDAKALELIAKQLSVEKIDSLTFAVEVLIKHHKKEGLLAQDPSDFFKQAFEKAVSSASASPTQSVPALAQWRTLNSHPKKDGQFVATSPERENYLKQLKSSMEDFLLNFEGEYGKGDIPWMHFVPAAGTKFTYLSKSNGLNGKITRIQVSGLGQNAFINGTLMLPVSGHNGNAKAREWAKTDTYDIRLDTNPNGIPSTHSTWGATGKEVALIRGAKSLDLITAQEVAIPLQKNVPVVLLYYRSGALGPSGYVEGRVIEFIWDGT